MRDGLEGPRNIPTSTPSEAVSRIYDQENAHQRGGRRREPRGNRGGRYLEEFDIETCHKEQNKSNIYKGVVVKVEAGLQAAFVSMVAARWVSPLGKCIRPVTPIQTSPNVVVASASMMC
jgi:hypothetical protein